MRTLSFEEYQKLCEHRLKFLAYVQLALGFVGPIGAFYALKKKYKGGFLLNARESFEGVGRYFVVSPNSQMSLEVIANQDSWPDFLLGFHKAIIVVDHLRQIITLTHTPKTKGALDKQYQKGGGQLKEFIGDRIFFSQKLLLCLESRGQDQGYKEKVSRDEKKTQNTQVKDSRVLDPVERVQRGGL